MRITAILAVSAGCACAGSTLGSAEPSSHATVAVCMAFGFDVQPLIVAERMASKMFAEIGVDTEWPKRGGSCLRGDTIIVTLSYQTKESDHPEAWAYALPYEGTHIVVFWDRIQRKVPTARAPVLLAHVLVHEITHILQGVSRHSETGMMRATWSADDMFKMIKKPLHFTEEDVDLIRRGLESRPTATLSLVK